MSTRHNRGKTNGNRSNSAEASDGASTATNEEYRAKPVQAAVPASAPSTSASSVDSGSGRKSASDVVTQQQLALLANQFLASSKNFTDADIDISLDSDMLALAKSRFESGLALIGLLEPHNSSSRECRSKFGELEVACFKIASKCGTQPWAQRFVNNFRSGSSSTGIAAATAAAAAAAAAVSDASSPIMTLASAAAASASAPAPRPASSSTNFSVLSSFPNMSSSSTATNPPILPAPQPNSERVVVLGRNQKPKEKKGPEVSIPGRGRKKVSPLEMSGKSSSVLSSAMYSIQTHAKNGGKISVMLSEAYRRRNDERRNKRKRKFGEVDAAVSKSLGNMAASGLKDVGNLHDDDDSEDDEQRAAFFQQSGGANARSNRASATSAQEVQQLEAEMMQSFDATLQAIRRFREARGDFSVPDDRSNYFAAFASPDGRFYGEQGNVEKGEYELMMQFFEALHAKPAEQWCRYSATKTKYNTFKCPLESFGVNDDNDEEGGNEHAQHVATSSSMSHHLQLQQQHHSHSQQHQQQSHLQSHHHHHETASSGVLGGHHESNSNNNNNNATFHGYHHHGHHLGDATNYNL